MSETVARHRPAHPRGEDTRRRLIDTAIEAFGTYGYDGTSTRMLAEQAAVTLPSIQYYFGSKEGLYRAAIGDIVERMEERLGPVADQARAALADPVVSDSVLLARLGDMLDALVMLIVSSDNPESRKRFINRAEIERGAALTPLHHAMRHHMIQPSCALVGRLLGRPAGDQEVVLRALAIIGQVSVFCHMGARSALGWGEVSNDHAKAIQAMVREHAAAIIDSARRSGR
jgi:TetR/AcrR family transcriptional regulator, regulator of cefoperazone and chloramphenicol sensitivity